MKIICICFPFTQIHTHNLGLNWTSAQTLALFAGLDRGLINVPGFPGHELVFSCIQHAHWHGLYQLAIQGIGSGDRLGSLMWFQMLLAFSALKSTAQRHPNVFGVFHTYQIHQVCSSAITNARGKWCVCVCVSVCVSPNSRLGKGDGAPSTLPVNSQISFCLSFTTTVTGRYYRVFAIFTGMKTEEQKSWGFIPGKRWSEK